MRMITTNNININKIVTTASGKEVPRDDCKRINGQYYKKHEECVYLPPIEGEKVSTSWYRIEHPSIGYNYTTGSYDKISRMKREGLIEGLIDKNKKGYFKLDPYINAVLFNSFGNYSMPEYAISKELAEECGYIEEISTGKYFKKDNLSKAELNHILAKRRLEYKELSLNYHANANNMSYVKVLQIHNEYLTNLTISDNSSRLAEMLNGLSFGVEFETSNGTIPYEKVTRLGLVPLRDGSIKGFEYTTVPLQGAKGLEILKESCLELSKRCEVDLQCSMHLHIGNIPRDRKYALAFIKLGYLIQNDIFNLVPSYKKDPRRRVKELAGKDKDYCKLLPEFKFFKSNIDVNNATNITKHFQEVFSFLTQMNNSGDKHLNGETERYNFDNKRNPIEAKWNQYGRYYWLSIFPYVFGSGTVEFRLHQPTLNFHRTINWLMINSAIVNYVIYNVDKILKPDFNISLQNIVNSYRTMFDQKDSESMITDSFREDVTDYLLAYMKDRTSKYSKDEKEGNYVDRDEMKDDCNYRFENKKIKELY